MAVIYNMAFEIWSNRFELKVAYSFPAGHAARSGLRYPVLCFLHGDKECERGSGKGKGIEQAMGEHGPLAKNSSPLARSEFIVVCPQLKHPGGDIWKDYRSTVLKLVMEMHEKEGGDPSRTYLTGFSYGGNGVWDIAAVGGEIPWTALWVVDPPRAPIAMSKYPTWLSPGPYARKSIAQFRQWEFRSRERAFESDYVEDDYGLDHGPTSQKAYADKFVYEWLIGMAGRPPHPQ